ncbi:MAG: hypothetical protein ACK5P6_02235, partial [Pseudobdellovibrionaceae bacterium]
IAQEHFASSFIRTKLATFLAIDFPPTVQSRILTATLSYSDPERVERDLPLIAQLQGPVCLGGLLSMTPTECSNGSR